MTTKRDLIDFEKIKRNWERASALHPGERVSSQPKLELPNRVGSGKALLFRIRALVLTDYGKHRDALLPFLDRAAELIDAIEAASREDEDRLRGELLAVLYDFEDLLEVYALKGK